MSLLLNNQFGEADDFYSFKKTIWNFKLSKSAI